jgi:hypothetical protein
MEIVGEKADALFTSSLHKKLKNDTSKLRLPL